MERASSEDPNPLRSRNRIIKEGLTHLGFLLDLQSTLVGLLERVGVEERLEEKEEVEEEELKKEGEVEEEKEEKGERRGRRLSLRKEDT